MDPIMVLGFTAAACTTLSFFPQVLKAWRTRRTSDLSLGMFSILTLGIFLWLIYGIARRDAPVAVANGITLLFVMSILVLKLKNG